MFRRHFSIKELNGTHIKGISTIEGLPPEEFEFFVKRSNYDDGTPKLTIVDQDGFPEYTATLHNFGPIIAENGRILIKSYSENHGISQLLIDANIIKEYRQITDGVVEAEIICDSLKEVRYEFG